MFLSLGHQRCFPATPEALPKDGHHLAKEGGSRFKAVLKHAGASSPVAGARSVKQRRGTATLDSQVAISLLSV